MGLAPGYVPGTSAASKDVVGAYQDLEFGPSI